MSDAAGTRLRFCLAATVAGVLAVVGVARAWDYAAGLPGLDYYQFWVVATATAEGHGDETYRPDGRGRLGAEFEARSAASGSGRWRAVAPFRRSLDTYSSPFLYAVVGWAAGGSYDRDYLVAQAVSLALFVLAVGALCLAAGFSLPEGLLLLAYATVAFDPFLSDVRVGNVTRLQVALLALAMALLRSGRAGTDAGAGVLLGLAGAFKPNLSLAPAALVLGLALRRATRRSLTIAAGAAAGALAAVAASAAYFGRLEVWMWWLRALPRLPPEIVTPARGNYALLALLGDGGARVAAIPVGLLLLLLVGVAARGAGGGDPARRLVALGALVGLLAAPLAWLHYYTLVLPALLDTLAPARLTRGRLALGAVLLLAFGSKPALLAPPQAPPIVSTALLATATAALLAVGLADLKRAAPPAETPQR